MTDLWQNGIMASQNWNGSPKEMTPYVCRIATIEYIVEIDRQLSWLWVRAASAFRLLFKWMKGCFRSALLSTLMHILWNVQFTYGRIGHFWFTLHRWQFFDCKSTMNWMSSSIFTIGIISWDTYIKSIHADAHDSVWTCLFIWILL